MTDNDKRFLRRNLPSKENVEKAVVDEDFRKKRFPHFQCLQCRIWGTNALEIKQNFTKNTALIYSPRIEDFYAGCSFYSVYLFECQDGIFSINGTIMKNEQKEIVTQWLSDEKERNSVFVPYLTEEKIRDILGILT